MNVEFTNHAWEEYTGWAETNPEIVTRINALVKSIRQNPFKGLGKPEPLKYDLQGFWSRRISSDHRLVYKVIGKKTIDQKCIIVQCKFHYDDK